METLREPCVRLSQVAFQDQAQFNPDNTEVQIRLKDVLDAIRSHEGPLDARTAEYVYFPIHHLLRKEVLSDRQTEYLLRIMGELVTRGWSTTLSLERAEQFIAVTIYLLSPDPPGAPTTAFLAKSDELHAAGFECLAALFTACDQSGLVKAIQKSPAIPHIIVVLLAGLGHDTAIEAQTACLVCIDRIISLIMRGQADHLAMVAPGVLSKLVKFIGSRPKWSAQVLALKALRSTLLNTFNDRDLGVESRVRSETWLETATNNINQFLPSIVTIMRQAKRQEIVYAAYEFASSVLMASEKTLQRCLPGLLDVVIFCSSQALNEEAAAEATSFLRTQCVSGLRREALAQNYSNEIEKLPRALSSQDEVAPASTLTSIGKTLAIVGTENASESIISILEDAVEFRLQADAPPAPQATLSLANLSRLPSRDIMLEDLGIKNLFPRTTEVAIQNLLIQIGSQTGETILADVVDRLRDDVGGQVTAMRHLWLAVYLLRGAQLSRGSDIYYDFLEYCYTSLAKSSTVGSHELAGHTLLCTYLIGDLAGYEGSEFKNYFVDILSPLFTLLGNEREDVRLESQRTISRISSATGYSSVLELVMDNKDYLVDGISAQIGTLDITPTTLGGLAALIHIGGHEIIPYVDDIFAALFNLLDRYHSYSRLVTATFMVFTTMIKTVKIPPLIKNDAHSTQYVRISSLEELEAELARKPKVDPSILENVGTVDEKIREVDEKQAQDLKEADELAKALAGDGSNDEADDSDDQSDKDDIDEPDDDLDEWSSAIPESTYKILEQIGDRCDRLISHNAADIRLACLNLLSSLVPLLASSEKNYLPFIHRIWPQLVERLFDPEVFVVEAAFHAVGSMAQHAGSFVSRRIDDLIPRLTRVYGDILKREWPQFSAERRKVVAISKALTLVVDNVDLNFESTETLLSAFRALFKRKDCRQLLEAFNAKSADLAWLVLLDEPLQPSTSGLSEITAPYS